MVIKIDQNIKGRGANFSLLRQAYPPILTSGEMLSHPGGWDKPIPKVVHLWRHRTSTPNNLEKSRLVCVLDIFLLIFGQEWEKESNTTLRKGLGNPILVSKILLHPRLGKPCRGLQILDTRMVFPRPSLNVVLDSINPSKVGRAPHLLINLLN